MSNLGELIGTNTDAVSAAGAGLGLLADFSGVLPGFISLFSGIGHADNQVQKSLDKLTSEVKGLAGQTGAGQLLEQFRAVDDYVAPALTVFDDLRNLLTAQLDAGSAEEHVL